VFAFVVEGAGTQTYSCLSAREAEIVAQMLEGYAELRPTQERMTAMNIRYNFHTWSERYPNSDGELFDMTLFSSGIAARKM